MQLIQNIIRRSKTFQDAIALERASNEALHESTIRRIQKLEGLIGKRYFEAAAVNRLTASWESQEIQIDQAIRQGLSAVRARARQLTGNNDYAKRYISEVRKNVVGYRGFKLQSNVKQIIQRKVKTDREANLKIQNAFAEWSKAENCSNNGLYSFRSICDLSIIAAARDGEFAVRKVINKASKFGFQLELVPTEAIDEKHNARLSNNNIVKMGVEIDTKHTPIAYWLKKTSPDLELYGGMSFSIERNRVPASELIHAFDREFAHQTRGISWMVQSMSRLNMLHAYEENELVASSIAAAAGGFFYQESGNAGPQVVWDGKDAKGNSYMDIEAGMFRHIGQNRFQAFEPKHPTNQYGRFIDGALYGVSAGLDVSFASLTGKLSEANYSSNRVGMLMEREKWMLIQQWFTEVFLQKIWKEWLEFAILSGQLKLPMSRVEEFLNPVWVGRRWGWIDPLKDAAATVMRLKGALTSHYQVMGEEGEDPEEVFEDIAEIQELAKEKGITIDLDGFQIGIQVKDEDPAKAKENGDAGAQGSQEQNLQLTAAKRKNGHNHLETVHADD